MYYKNSFNIGIRRKFGDKAQCFSFGGKRCGLSREVLWGHGCMVLQKLDGGMTETDVKEWVDEAVAR